MTLRRVEGFERRSPTVNGVARYVTNGGTSYTAPGSTGTGVHATSSGGNNHEVFMDFIFGFTDKRQVACGGRIQFRTAVIMANRVGIQLREGTTTHVGLARNNTTGKLELYRGDVYTAGALLGTSEAAFTDLNVYHFYEIEAYIDNTDGWVKVYLNEELVIDVSGVDTQNGLTGCPTRLYVGGLANSACWFDDFYVCDAEGGGLDATVLGDVSIEGLFPNADGDSSQFVGSDGNSLLNYQLVDDTSITDYVGSATPGARDLYNLQNVPAGGGAVLAVEVNTLVAKSDAGTPPGDLKEVLKATGTGTVATSTVATPAMISTTAQWVAGPLRKTDPDGAAWNVAKVDGLQAGVEISA